MGKLARACAEAAIHGRRWRVPDPSCGRVRMAGTRSVSRGLSRCDVEHSPDDRPSPHVIRVSILLVFKAAPPAPRRRRAYADASAARGVRPPAGPRAARACLCRLRHVAAAYEMILVRELVRPH